MKFKNQLAHCRIFLRKDYVAFIRREQREVSELIPKAAREEMRCTLGFA